MSAHVSQCVQCGTLTMMPKCPKCDLPTKVYFPPGSSRYQSFAGTTSNGSTSVPYSSGGPQSNSLPPPVVGNATPVASTPWRPPSPPRRSSPPSSAVVAAAAHTAALRSADARARDYPDSHALQVEVERLSRELRQKEDDLKYLRHDVFGGKAMTQTDLQDLWRQVRHEGDGKDKISLLERDLQSLREKYNALLAEKDRWMLDSISRQEQANDTVAKCSVEIEGSRNELRVAVQRIGELEGMNASLLRSKAEVEDQLQAQKQKMIQATNEVRELQRAVGTAREHEREETSMLKKELAQADHTNRALEAQLQETQTANIELRDQLEAMAQYRKASQTKLQELQKELEHQREKQASVERQLSLSEVEQQASRDEMKSLRDRLTQAHRELDDAVHMKTLLEKRLEREGEKTAGNTALQVELDRSKFNFNSLAEDYTVAKKEKAEATQAAEALRVELRKLHSANELLDEEVRHSRANNEVLSKELQTLRTELKQLGMQFRNQEQVSLNERQQTLQQHHAELQETHQELQRLQQENQQLQRDVDTSRGRVLDVEQQARFKFQELQLEIEKRDAEIERASLTLRRKQDMSPTRVELQRLELEDRVEQLEQSLREAEDKSKEQLLQLDALRVSLGDAQRSVESADKRHASSAKVLQDISDAAGGLYESKDLPDAIRLVMKERRVAIEDAEQLKAELHRRELHLSDEMTVLRRDVDRLTTQNARLHEELLTTEREALRTRTTSEASLQETIDKLQREKEVGARELQGQLSDTQRSLASTAEEVRLLRETNSKLQQEVEQLRDEASHYSRNKSLLSAEADRLKASVMQLTQELTEATLEISNKNSIVAATNTHASELQRGLEKGKSEAQRLQAELAHTTSRLETFEAEHDDIIRELRDKNQHEFDTLRSQLRSERQKRLQDSDAAREAETSLLALQTDFERVATEKDKLARDLDSSRKAQAAKTDAFQRALDDAERTKMRLTSELDDVRSECSERRLEHDRLVSELRKLQEQVHELGRQRESALRQIDTYKVERDVALKDSARRAGSHANGQYAPLPTSHSSSLLVDRSPPPPKSASLHMNNSSAGGEASPDRTRPNNGSLGAKERNDALLQHFREQRHALPMPRSLPTGAGSPSSSGGNLPSPPRPRAIDPHETVATLGAFRR